jgi:hypothetical protein
MINISVRVLSKSDRDRLQWVNQHLGLGSPVGYLPCLVLDGHTLEL